MSSPPTISAPAASASRTFSPLAMTKTSSTCPSHAAEPPCRAPSGQHAWDRLPGASSSRSRRTRRLPLLQERHRILWSVGQGLRRRRAFSMFFTNFLIALLVSHTVPAAKRPCRRADSGLATAKLAYTPFFNARRAPQYLHSSPLHSTDAAFRSGIFCLAMSSLFGDLPDLVLVGRARTFRHSRCAFTNRIAAGGVW